MKIGLKSHNPRQKSLRGMRLFYIEKGSARATARCRYCLERCSDPRVRMYFHYKVYMWSEEGHRCDDMAYFCLQCIEDALAKEVVSRYNDSPHMPLNELLTSDSAEDRFLGKILHKDTTSAKTNVFS